MDTNARKNSNTNATITAAGATRPSRRATCANPPIRTGRRRAGALLLLTAGSLIAAPAHAQAIFDQLLRVLRERVAIAIPGVDTQALATPEYIATVLQQVINKNQDELISAQFLARPHDRDPRIGTATMVIDIDSSGRLIDARLGCATGQGRALAGKAVNAVRRAGPYPPPVFADPNVRSGRVTIDETFVFEASGRWNLQSAIDAVRNQPGG